MESFCGYSKGGENIGEIVLETLISFNIGSVTDLDFSTNPSWFRRFNNVELLAELILKQAGL